MECPLGWSIAQQSHRRSPAREDRPFGLLHVAAPGARCGPEIGAHVAQGHDGGGHNYETFRERQRQGIEIAKRAGRYNGRRPNLALHKRILGLRETGMSISRGPGRWLAGVHRLRRGWRAQPRSAERGGHARPRYRRRGYAIGDGRAAVMVGRDRRRSAGADPRPRRADRPVSRRGAPADRAR